MGTSGLHNILEPAADGIPILIGKNYSKFPEAKALIDLGGVVSVHDSNSCTYQIKTLIEDESIRLQQGAINNQYVLENQGATQKTLRLLNKAL